MPYTHIEKADEADLIAIANNRESEVYAGTTITFSPIFTTIPITIIMTA